MVPPPLEAQRRRLAGAGLVGLRAARGRGGAAASGSGRGNRGGRLGALATPLEAYGAAVEVAPLATKAATSAAIFAVSDAVAQRGEGTAAWGLKLGRTARYSLFGACSAPLFDAYYTVQDTVVDKAGLGLGPAGDATVKIAVDQLLWTPWIYLPLFFGSMVLMEGRGAAAAAAEVRERGLGLTPTLIANWKFWIPVNVGTYGFVPPEFRILYTNVASLLWTIYLSSAREAAKEGKADGR